MEVVPLPAHFATAGRSMSTDRGHLGATRLLPFAAAVDRTANSKSPELVGTSGAGTGLRVMGRKGLGICWQLAGLVRGEHVNVPGRRYHNVQLHAVRTVFQQDRACQRVRVLCRCFRHYGQWRQR